MNLQKQLASPRVENENGAIDGLCCEISLKCLVDSDTIHICVIYKPDDLIAEDLTIVL